MTTFAPQIADPPSYDSKPTERPAGRRNSAQQPTGRSIPNAGTAAEQPLDHAVQARSRTQRRCGGVVEHPYDLSGYIELKVWAEMFADAQEERIATENRINRAGVDFVHFLGEFYVEMPKKASVSGRTKKGKEQEPPKMQLRHYRQREDEHAKQLKLRGQYRRTAPAGVIAWQKASKGIGIDSLAQVLGHLGHPRIAEPMHWEGEGKERHLVRDEPFERSVSQLWQYAGHGSPGKPQRGTKDFAEWAAYGKPKLKSLVWLMSKWAVMEPGRDIDNLLAQIADPPRDRTIPTAAAAGRRNSAQQPTDMPTPSPSAAAEQVLPFADPPTKTSIPTYGTAGRRSSAQQPIADPIPKESPAAEQVLNPVGTAKWPYRQVYEARRIATIGRVYATPCVRCGPKGRPAEVGTPWSKAHAHADALRIVGKAILRDIWIAAGQDGSPTDASDLGWDDFDPDE